jgi:hypothetical protein
MLFSRRERFEAEGIDISPTAIAIAQEQAKERRLSIKYRVADVCHDELAQQRYDGGRVRNNLVQLGYARKGRYKCYLPGDL